MDIGAALVVRSADGTIVSTDPPQISRRSISTAVPAEAPPGDYTVAYRVVSADGHTISATYSYTIAGASPAVEATPLDPAASAPPGTAAAEVPEATPTPTAEATGPPSGQATPPWGLIAGALALGALAVALVLGATRRGSS